MEEPETLEVATAVPFNPDIDSFLLLKRADTHKREPGLWEFPAGKIEDEKPGEAALRELKEETGMIGEILKTGEPFSVEINTGETVKVNPFLVRVESRLVRLSKEHVEHKWVERGNLRNLELETVKGFQKDLRSVV